MKLTEPEASTAKAILGSLKRTPAHTFPEVSALSVTLSKIAPATPSDIDVGANIIKQFATASIDAWLRAVHSFLISTSLTDSSPIWSSVAGYYSSHYTMRAFAHLLGYFLLYKKKYVVKINVSGGSYSCSYSRKGASEREHKAYWKLVNSISPFQNNPLYPLNNPDTAPSDVAHRDRANYADHLRQYYLNFALIDDLVTRERIKKITKIAFTEPPIPNRDNFPDIDSVQIVSYHRLVQYRRIVDEIITENNRFWEVNREPSFASAYLNYQLVDSSLSDFL